MAQSQNSTETESDVDFPYWMQLGDDPWCSELNDPPREFILVQGREVYVARSYARGTHIIEMEYWPRWVGCLGVFAIPFILAGIFRERKISLSIQNLEPNASCRPTFVVRVKGYVILRTTNFDLAREQVRYEIMKR